jgi:hypothetical protein
MTEAPGLQSDQDLGDGTRRRVFGAEVFPDQVSDGHPCGVGARLGTVHDDGSWPGQTMSAAEPNRVPTP